MTRPYALIICLHHPPGAGQCTEIWRRLLTRGLGYWQFCLTRGGGNLTNWFSVHVFFAKKFSDPFCCILKMEKLSCEDVYEFWKSMPIYFKVCTTVFYILQILFYNIFESWNSYKILAFIFYIFPHAIFVNCILLKLYKWSTFSLNCLCKSSPIFPSHRAFWPANYAPG